MDADMKKLTGAFGFVIFAVFLIPLLQDIIATQNLTGVLATVFPYVPTLMSIGVLIVVMRSIF